MNNIFVILMIVSMVAVVGSLVLGLYSMTRGGAFNEKYGNRLMQLRVTLQGLALLFFFLAWMTSGK